MRIDHLALWTPDLERLRAFYECYFDARSGPLYRSRTRPGFTSYFLAFPTGDSRLELMSLPESRGSSERAAAQRGLAHFAVAVGARRAVDALVARLAADGCVIISEPRVTGDGYYEAVVEDPDGNLVEITADR